MTAQPDIKHEGPRSKRGVILDAAIDYFGEVGFEHTKWATIADQVGIGQTALYHYFESKVHCLLTIMTAELARSVERFESATADSASSDEALKAAVNAAFDVTSREVLQMRILQNHMDLLSTKRHSEKEEIERLKARALVKQIENNWISLVERGIAGGDFAKRDSRQSGLALLAMLVSVWRWYRSDGPVSLNDVRDFTRDTCVRIVTA